LLRLVFEGAEMMEECCFFTKEAEYLGVRRETVYVYLEKKNLPGYRIGKFWRFKIAEVDAWVLC
jgi:excisionase family DNA binding protein